MKSSFLPKYESNIVRLSALYCATLQARNPCNFWFIFWEKWWLHKFMRKVMYCPLMYKTRSVFCTLCWYVIILYQKRKWRWKNRKIYKFLFKIKILTFCNTLTINLLLWSVGFSAEIITVSKTGRSGKFLSRFYFKTTKTRDITFFKALIKLQ